MFRNQYDTDVTTWNPQGRLFQVEYAMEAVKQGSCAVGLKLRFKASAGFIAAGGLYNNCESDTHVVLATLKRSHSELSSFQRKVFKVDDHMGAAIAGLTGDGRGLCKYMRSECINHRFVYDAPLPVGRLVKQVADKSQIATQRSWKRPYGVGLLVGGVDGAGPHLYNTCPSGNYYEYKAMAIGSRAQAAKTYLEKHFEKFPGSSLEELIAHGLRALQASLSDGELTDASVAVAIVGKGLPFTVVEGAGIAPYITALKEEEPVVADPMPVVADADLGGAAAADAAMNEGVAAPGEGGNEQAAAGGAGEGGAAEAPPPDEPAPMVE